MLRQLNQAIEEFEPTVRLLYRLGIVLAIYFGLVYIGDSLVVTDGEQADTSCQVAPRLSS